MRRLKDSYLAQVGSMMKEALPFYAVLCGVTLAHACAGDAAVIAEHLGQGAVLNEAVGEFAMAYADQTERDWRSFSGAISAGRVMAAKGEGLRRFQRWLLVVKSSYLNKTSGNCKLLMQRTA